MNEMTFVSSEIDDWGNVTIIWEQDGLYYEEIQYAEGGASWRPIDYD